MAEGESDILTFLEGSPESFVGRREIARRAVKRSVYEQNPHWVDAPLASLMNQGLLEQNDQGLYRLKKSGLVN